MRNKGGKYRVLGIFCTAQVLLLIISSNVAAPGYITISIQAQPPIVNINQSNEPLIMNCSLGYQGVSALPYTIYMDAYCDVGEVYLTQYQFVFHLPDTIPFDAIIFIDPETENDTQGVISLSAYYEAGGVRQSYGPVSQLIIVQNYDPTRIEENITPEFFGYEDSYEPIFIYVLPSLFIFLGVYVKVIRPKLRKKP
jgi:hypothetical protein